MWPEWQWPVGSAGGRGARPEGQEVAVEVVSPGSAAAGLLLSCLDMETGCTCVWLAALPRPVEPGSRSPSGTELRGELTGQASQYLHPSSLLLVKHSMPAYTVSVLGPGRTNSCHLCEIIAQHVLQRENYLN